VKIFALEIGARPLRSTAPWLLALGALLLVGLLYRLGNHVDHTDLFRVELKVKELNNLDIGRNLDVLKLLQRTKSDYDTLAVSDQQAQAFFGEMDAEFVRQGIGPSLHKARAVWDDKQEQIERFKRFNAVLTNSHKHFVNLVEQLSERGDSPLSGRLLPVARPPLLHETTRSLLVFMAEGRSEDVPALTRKLNGLGDEIGRWPAQKQANGRLLVAHGVMVLSHHLRVRQLATEALSSPFQSVLNDAYRRYSDIFAEAERIAKIYRTLLAGLSLLLIAGIVLAALRLRRTASELASSFRLLDNIADHLDEGIVACDGTCRISFINRRGEQLLGCSADDLLGRPLIESLIGVQADENEPEADTKGEAKIVPGIQLAIRQQQTFTGECLLLTASGRRFPAQINGGPLPSPEQNGAAGYVASFRDVSEMRKAEARLQIASRVFDNLAEGMVITDRAGRIQNVNAAFTAITGYTEAECSARTPGQILGSGTQGKDYFREMWEVLRQRNSWQGELVNRRKNGELYTEWLSISAVPDATGEVLNYIGLFTDISERKAAEAYIHHLAYHDVLTGLANRLLFQDRLNIALSQAQRSQRQLAVLLLDLDRFKVVNDTLGHLTGDKLLQRVALRVSEQIRQGDTLARLGGDEFVLLMPEIQSEADAANVARKLISALLPVVNIDGQELQVTTSVGIAVYPAHGSTTEELIKHADVALYAAKDGGRNTYRFFDTETAGESLELLELETDLRHAVARQQLLLHYQLQIDAQSGLANGVEALVRWQHPVKGLVSPGRFIPLAEERGMIEEIGAWCLETACAQLVSWRAAGVAIPRIAVNVSALQLRVPNFAERVLSIVEATGILPSELEIELTESSLTEDPVHAFTVFEALRRTGIRIAIDDFGTGYSSLSYLSQYPVDVVKIDQSFVRNIEDESEAPYIVQAVILLARGMKMESIAEGVESEGQRKKLVELGCDTLQGFFFAKPHPAEAIPGLLARLDAKNGKALASQPSA
jgi:diguanylate cyclase (GGDEF)-like protein/PAS domain S-box-containing protein